MTTSALPTAGALSASQIETDKYTHNVLPADGEVGAVALRLLVNYEVVAINGMHDLTDLNRDVPEVWWLRGHLQTKPGVVPQEHVRFKAKLGRWALDFDLGGLWAQCAEAEPAAYSGLSWLRLERPLGILRR